MGVTGGARIVENHKFSMHFHLVDIGVGGRVGGVSEISFSKDSRFNFRGG